MLLNPCQAIRISQSEIRNLHLPQLFRLERRSPARQVLGPNIRNSSPVLHPPTSAPQAFRFLISTFYFSSSVLPQPSPVPKPVHPQHNRHQKINPSAPRDFFYRQTKGKHELHEPQAHP